MGLGIAQVRLLALTHRKSDIELEMSIDSKRKQQLTRRSTELSQTYYSRLNNYNYQYSTTGGFNDLDYNYLMGECNTAGSTSNFTERFLNQIYFGHGDVDSKIDNRVILTNNKGNVILNSDLVELVEVSNIYSYEGLKSDGTSPTVYDKTAYAIWNFVQSNRDLESYGALFKAFTGNLEDGDSNFNVYSGIHDDKLEAINGIINIIKTLMDNGGAEDGGTVYICVNQDDNLASRINSIDWNDSTQVTNYNPSWEGEYGQVTSKADAINGDCEYISSECRNHHVYSDDMCNTPVTLKKGACYTVLNNVKDASNHTVVSTNVKKWYWDGNQFVPNLTFDWLQYLSNIIDYLAPMLSAAIQNGYTGSISYDQYTGDFQGAKYLPPSLVTNGNNPDGSDDVGVQLGVLRDNFRTTWLGQLERDSDGNPIAGQYALYNIIRANGSGGWIFAFWVDNSGNTHDDWATNQDFNNFLMDRDFAEYNSTHSFPHRIRFGDAPTNYYSTHSSEYQRDYGWTEQTVRDCLSDGQCCYLAGKCFVMLGGNDQEITWSQYQSYISSTGNTDTFQDVQDVNTLQDGLKSGVYQLCMVDNVTTGTYHKNTTMDYFIHRNLCVEKIDMSKREELTAWYNAEQAALSNQEDYWDEEITNLSTELTSINAEIDSVKNLKSNAIKSVFSWGGN